MVACSDFFLFSFKLFAENSERQREQLVTVAPEELVTDRQTVSVVTRLMSPPPLLSGSWKEKAEENLLSDVNYKSLF